MKDNVYPVKFSVRFASTPSLTKHRNKKKRFFDFGVKSLCFENLQFVKKSLIIWLSTIFILSGCGIFGGTSEPVTVNLIISASKKLNPDMGNRASPTVIRIYQLTQIDSFNNSNFFALYEKDQTLLAKDLKYREELDIQPGKSTTQALEINSKSKYIAVLAAFRNLDKAQWKAFLKIDPLDPQSLKIEVGESTIIIKNADSNGWWSIF